MKADELKFSLVDSYLELLKTLSPDSKLEIISKLSDSLKGSKRFTKKSIGELYGSFVSQKTADEILGEIKSNRIFNRKIEGL
jgi:hypothetical protein